MPENFTYTQVLDALILKYHEIYPALVFGKIRRYEQGKDKYCSASYQRIAEELTISKSTVSRSMKKLLTDKLIVDISPNKSNIIGTTRRYITNQKVLDTVVSQTYVPQTDVSQTQTDVSQTQTDVSQTQTDVSQTIKETKKQETIRNKFSKKFLEYYNNNKFLNKDIENFIVSIESYINSEDILNYIFTHTKQQSDLSNHEINYIKDNIAQTEMPF